MNSKRRMTFLNGTDRKIRLCIEYDGSAYAGLQIQAGNLPTIQGRIEQAIEVITGHMSRLHAAGRTDAGVHALALVAHFSTRSSIPAEKFAHALNANLPGDIVIIESREVDEEFDSRRQARGKIYRYTILNRQMRSALMRERAWHIRAPLDVAAMQHAARHLLGEHDFSSFKASGCASRHPVRRLYMFEVKKEGDLVTFEVFGTAFLKQMVRNMVGTLVEVGLGRMDADGMPAVLEARDRTCAGQTAPAQGLILLKVFYQDDPPPSELQVLMPEDHRIKINLR